MLSLLQVIVGGKGALSPGFLFVYREGRTSFLDLLFCLADWRRKYPLAFFGHRREVVMHWAIVSLRIYILPFEQ